jgi:superfamily II DNA or RNA helicase
LKTGIGFGKRCAASAASTSRTAGVLADSNRPDVEITNISVHPYGYQRAVLADLAAERLVHGRHRNLVVMATGTGKTVVAALDYRDLRGKLNVDSLLFVAHQEQILRQSRSVFRHVLRDGSFGEVLVSGEKPRDWRHVFASVQSLHRRPAGSGNRSRSSPIGGQ